MSDAEKNNGIIVIVDDNANNLRVLSEILQRANYSVRAALSGELALRSLEVSKPDLILLDIRMPGEDGYSICQRLKNEENTKDIPVIFISALHEMEDKIKAFQVGGVDYLTKPFQEEEILARVRAHVELNRIKNHLEFLVQERTQRLEESEASYRALFHGAPLAAIVYQADSGEVLAANDACAKMLSVSAKDIIGKPFYFAAEQDQQAKLKSLHHSVTSHSEETAYTGIIRLRSKDNRLIKTEGVLRRIDYPGYDAQILMLQDVTLRLEAEQQLNIAEKTHQQELTQLILYDDLTDLPNRRQLTQIMRQKVDHAKRKQSKLVLCYLDVDDFQMINEQHGEETGDKALVFLAERLRSYLRGGEIVARIGGDEFALLLSNINDEDELKLFLEGLLLHLKKPISLGETSITLSSCIGVTVYPDDHSDPDTLLRHADHAMMLAKQAGHSSYELFDLADADRIKRQRENIKQMETGLENGEFLLYYQPKVNQKLNKVVGLEALIRWQHPKRGFLSPGSFLPEIENSDSMFMFDDWVIKTALMQMEAWHKDGLDLPVSVNVSAHHLMTENFVDRLADMLGQYNNVVKGNLEIEVLEQSSIDDIEHVERIISDCRSLGVGFALDDFGTGYSSLTYLRRLSADTLKIDQSFVINMLTNPQDAAIVEGVIGLAQSFRRKVIAEGVETIEHAEVLLEKGCEVMQGYGIARPMPAEDVKDWVNEWSSSST